LTRYRPNTKPAPGHKIYAYLLRKLAVSRPNLVWATDITYIPMARGFVYLIAIVDWFSRRVLSWRLSITLETDFCIEALEEALTRFGAPEIFNADQGSQFTSMAFTSVLHREKIAISMDGRGAWRDNVSGKSASVADGWKAALRSHHSRMAAFRIVWQRAHRQEWRG
jgi:putative transposase